MYTVLKNNSGNAFNAGILLLRTIHSEMYEDWVEKTKVSISSNYICKRKALFFGVKLSDLCCAVRGRPIFTKCQTWGQPKGGPLRRKKVGGQYLEI